MNCGLGNNGGSQTIVNSANTLHKMGHDVTIIDNMHNKHTWTPLLAEHLIIKNIKNCPPCDCIIGTGINTFENVSKCTVAKHKVHWIRGWELWQKKESAMIKMFENNLDVHLLTNGIGIQSLLEKYNISSTIQLAGLDIPIVKRLHNYKKSSVLRIGGLVNYRHDTKQTEYIFKVYKYLCQILPDVVELYTYGTSSVKRHLLDDHIHLVSPDKQAKNDMYDKIDIWLSTSVSEGFHIPPAEYMLTGGVVMGVDHPLNGTKQYLLNNKTGLVVEISFCYRK